jgi:hypothetical protein
MLSLTGCLMGLLLAGTPTPPAPAEAALNRVPLPAQRFRASVAKRPAQRPAATRPGKTRESETALAFGPARISLGSLLQDDPPPPATQTVEETPAEWLSRHRFFLEAGTINNYAYMHHSHDLVYRYLDRPFGRLPGYSPPREYYDLRRQGLLFTAYGAIGYSPNQWLDLTLEGGGWGGGMSDRSTPLFVSKLKTHWHYTDLFGQVGMRVYPFGRPAPEPGLSCTNLFKQTRPFLYQSLGVTRYSSVGDVTLSVRDLPEPVRVRVDMAHWVGTYKLGAGAEMPVSRHLSLVLFGNYSFFFHEHDELDGFAINIAARLRL